MVVKSNGEYVNVLFVKYLLPMRARDVIIYATRAAACAANCGFVIFEKYKIRNRWIFKNMKSYIK